MKVVYLIAGNLPLVTASEAATMEYVRLRYLSGSDEFHPFPKVPRVLAWDGSFGGPVAWPYILCEHMPGVTLDSRWLSIEGNTLKESIHAVVMFETNILQEAFSQHGSLFFAESVSQELRGHPLYAEPPIDPLRIDLARRFRIGPTVYREWWRGPYGQVPANRGPWGDFPTMISSAAEFQLQCLENGIDHTSPFVESTAVDIPFICRMLKACIAIAPLIAPTNLFMRRPVLNHADLSLGNFIVRPEVYPCIWDVFASGFIETTSDGSPALPAGFDSMSSDQQDRVRTHMELVRRFKEYYLDAATTWPERHEAWRLPTGLRMASLLKYILRCKADGPIELRTLLVEIQEAWHLISDQPCPIDFSEEESEQETYRVQQQEWYSREVDDNDLLTALGCGGDGWVSDEKFEEASQNLDKFRRLWEENEATLKRPFPFFDGAPGLYLS
ncbi:hypothetical protein BDZ97DRAFT_1918590 [Flammula alnicola]|nr:hypothetical protein BDZ97DRAFT_1918590 [Flammula alnicola]